MASSKLKAKTVERTALYYGKYEYRAVVNSPNMFYTWSCKTIDQFKSRIQEITLEYEQNSDKPNWLTWRRPKPIIEDWEYELIENVLNLEQKYKIKQDFTLRREGNNCCIYTSNKKLLTEVLSFAPDAKVDQVVLMPTGVLVFKREPPAKYRAYMSNRKMPLDFKEDFIEYMNRTPDIRPSNAFYTYLHRSSNGHYPPWLWDKYYIDYDDEKNLMMMTLMFPGMIGKKFKLEKK